MEDFKDNVYDRVIVNNDRDFIENDNVDVSATYIVLCEDNYENNVNKAMYDYKVSGLSLAEWVAMACESRPVFITINKNEKFLNLIKPYMENNDYTIVLYADTPLVSKTHLKDLLGYVERKRLNVCKLKRGYILKNEYISQVDEIYSSLVYDLSSNDFFQVSNFNDVEKIRETLESRMFGFHKKNGVIFYNQDSAIVDANVQIGYGTKIAGGSSLLKNSLIGKNVDIQANAVIINSKIGDGVTIGASCLIENSIVKSGSVLRPQTLLSHSVIGESVIIGIGSKIVSSAVKDNVGIGDFCNIESINVLENVKIGVASTIVGVDVVAAIDENSVIQAGAKIIRKNMENND